MICEKCSLTLCLKACKESIEYIKTICFIFYQTLKSDVVYFCRPAYTYKFILQKNYAVKKIGCQIK